MNSRVDDWKVNVLAIHQLTLDWIDKTDKLKVCLHGYAGLISFLLVCLMATTFIIANTAKISMKDVDQAQPPLLNNCMVIKEPSAPPMK